MILLCWWNFKLCSKCFILYLFVFRRWSSDYEKHMQLDYWMCKNSTFQTTEFSEHKDWNSISFAELFEYALYQEKSMCNIFDHLLVQWAIHLKKIHTILYHLNIAITIFQLSWILQTPIQIIINRGTHLFCYIINILQIHR